MAKRRSSKIPKYKRRRKGSLFGRLISWIVKLVLGLLAFSVVWVLAYRFVNPPITINMIGDIIHGHGAAQGLDADRGDRPRHGPRSDRRRGQQVLFA